MAKRIVVLLADEYASMELVRSLNEAGFHGMTSMDEPPDLIVLDVGFHGEAPVRALHEIETKCHASGIPIIQIGEMPSPKLGEMIRKFGTTKRLKKPADTPMIIKEIKNIFERLGQLGE